MSSSFVNLFYGLVIALSVHQAERKLQKKNTLEWEWFITLSVLACVICHISNSRTVEQSETWVKSSKNLATSLLEIRQNICTQITVKKHSQHLKCFFWCFLAPLYWSWFWKLGNTTQILPSLSWVKFSHMMHLDQRSRIAAKLFHSPLLFNYSK